MRRSLYVRTIYVLVILLSLAMAAGAPNSWGG